MEAYFYIDTTGKQQGPVSLNTLTQIGLNSNTLIWKNGLAGWQIAGTVPELLPYLRPQPPFTTAISNSSACPPPAKPDSLLIWSILSTVVCCLPIGLIAVVHATRVDPLWNQGEYEAATKEAQSAKIGCIVSCILGFFFYIIMFFVQWSSR